MKVFISWSGTQSKKVGEAVRDWLPAVLQAVTPYFTPSDIEKGTRWSTEIGKELSQSEIGILCVTQDNIHSDWILFEAGALSKSIDKSNVCPMLFGITNTDLAGPLKQFQTTEFIKDDVLKLLGVVNNKLGDHKLPQKTLETVFNKWWPDLEERISNILDDIAQPDEPIRKDRELLEEILQLSRVNSMRSVRSRIAPGALKDLLSHYIQLHNEQAAGEGSYQDTLNALQKMHKAIDYIVHRSGGMDEELDEQIEEFQSLSYKVEKKVEVEEDDDIPF